MKRFLFWIFLPLAAFARCGGLPPPFKAEVRLLHIVNLSSSPNRIQCGVELEIRTGAGGWLRKGEKADFWSNNSEICNAPANTVTTVTLVKDCCDAQYDWCDAQWRSGNTKKTARGNRIWNAKGNPTF